MEGGERLGGWLQNQRKRYAARGLSEGERGAKKISAMSDEEVRRLEALGVAWDVLAEQWERMHGLLRIFRELHTDTWPVRYRDEPVFTLKHFLHDF